jgi:hypothetical protein
MCIGGLDWSQRLTARESALNEVQLTTLAKTKESVLLAHLWFEEWVGGDESIQLDKDVFQQLDKAIDVLTALLDPGSGDQQQHIRPGRTLTTSNHFLKN